MAARKKDKRAKSLDYWAKRTSKCRRETKQKSCFSCSEYDNCNLIQSYNEVLKR